MKFLSPIVFSMFFLCCTYLGIAQNKKSAITILSPEAGTVWNIPETVRLEWTVENIDSGKSTRFFLVRDEMVVQELGSFPNTGIKEGIELAKNIGSGDTYQVVGIELFPEDKLNIAKFVTPFFSIKNKASDDIKQRKEQAKPVTIKEKRAKKRQRTTVKKREANPPEMKPATTEKREEFDGRKISYTQELAFNTTDITVKIWDHGRQDGDIVSIYLNGKPVVYKYYLTYWKREFKIKLNPDRANDMFLYAHNLGDAPPNTVSIEITDGTKSENLVLNSDLQSCEAVMLTVKK